MDWACSVVHLTAMKVLLLYLMLMVPLSAAERAALLIGNHRYQTDGFGAIPAAVADLRAMKESLLVTGFAAADIQSLPDATTAQMKEAVVAFAKKYAGKPEVVFYYSGHGVAVDGLNFLAGTDASLDPGQKLKALETAFADDPAELQRQKDQLIRTLTGKACLPLDTVSKTLLGMSTDRSHVRVILLDACRNKPELATKSFFAKAAGGLAAVEPQSGLFIGFASGAGQVSISNEDESTNTPSLFTKYFAARMKEPGTIDEIFMDVLNKVEPESEAIAKRSGVVLTQTPAKYGQLKRPFAFVKTVAVLPGVPGPKPENMVRPETPTPAAPSGPLRAALNTAPFINTLGMEFVPVAATPGVFWSRWETRVRDYAAFCRDTNRAHEKPDFAQGVDHPVVNVSFEDAQEFCVWLSKKEGRAYRLPTDHEWSCAVGIGAQEDAAASPKAKDMGIKGVYPWGTAWPPPKGSGNFGSSLKVDSYDNTSPVGSFSPTADGLYDLSGNAWEWCDSLYDPNATDRVLRGGSWNFINPSYLLSSYRYNFHPTIRIDFYGFRVVLGVGGGG